MIKYYKLHSCYYDKKCQRVFEYDEFYLITQWADTDDIIIKKTNGQTVIEILDIGQITMFTGEKKIMIYRVWRTFRGSFVHTCDKQNLIIQAKS